MVQHYGIRRRDRGVIRPFLAGGALGGGVLVAAGIVGAGWFSNPFHTETVDRSPAPVLTELRDLAEFHAAQASFEVIVDQEDDVAFVPQFIAGERTQFVAVGTVDAVVDFTGIEPSDVSVDETGTVVTITLPTATLAAPEIDHAQSHVMNRDRGLVDRVSGALVDSPTGEHELLLAAEAEMSGAAASTDLARRAETSTRAMLRSLLAPLGYERVVVEFRALTSSRLA